MPKHRITHELGDPEPPKPHENNAARIIADYFDSDLVFIRKKQFVSPDLFIVRTNQVWELKSPLGNGKRTIANNLRDAAGQSKLIILDLSRCKMNNDKAMSRIRGFMQSGDAHIKKLLVIDKSGQVIDYYSNVRYN